VIIGGLVVLVLTAALVAPYFIDWTSYRAAFEREASRILGREVRVEGTARARLLPFPSVTFTDVVVAGAEPGDPAMTVDEFSMDAELAPFLRGELLIFDMRLVRPSASIEIASTGQVDWAVRPSSPFDPSQIRLEGVTVSAGTITVLQHASGRTVTLSNINSEISARSLAGPWRVTGTLQVNGLPVTLTASTGTASDGAMRVRISAQPRDYPVLIETDGEARLDQEQGRYSGTFRFVNANPSEEAQEASAAAVNPGNRVAGRFSLDHQRLAIDEFRFQTGPEDAPYTADGTAAVDFGANPSFSVTADGAQIRLDESQAEAGVISGLSADERFAALRAFITNLPKPAIPGSIALNLPAIVAGDTTIRDIRIRAQPAEEGWNIASAAATLPGRTRFEGEGLLTTGAAPSFSGRMLLAVTQPSGFAAWVARDVDEAIRHLPAAGFSADVLLSKERQRFDNMELILGDARFRGAINRQSPEDARPSLMLKLDGNRLDLEGMRAFASLFISDAGRNRLGDHNVDLDITAGPVSAQGFTAERLDAAMRLREGTLEIDRFTLTGLADANISATGTVSNIGAEPTGKLDASVIAVDLAPLAELLAQRFPDMPFISALSSNAAAYPGLLADSELNIIANTEGGLSAAIKGVSGGTAVDLSVSGQGALTDLANAELTTRLTAQNENASALYALLGFPALPLGFTGAAQVEWLAEGIPARGMETEFSFSGQGLDASFNGQVRAGESLAIQGNARLEADDLEPWLAEAGISLPGFGYGLPAVLSAGLDGGDGLLVISNLQGAVAERNVSGDLNAELRERVPHLTGSLTMAGFDLGLAAEMVAGSRAFEAGEGAWPQAPFSGNEISPFTADVELTARELWFGNSAAANDAHMRLKIGPEGFAVSDFTGQIFGGTMEGLAEFRNDAGTGLFSAQMSLRDAPLEAVLPGSGISGHSDVSASVTASGKSVGAMVSALSGSGSASLRNLIVSGINPAAIAPILEEADSLGVEINGENVRAFAPALVRRDRLSAGNVDLAFTIANGVARMPPVQLESRGTRMSVEAAADLRDETVSASGTITYDPGLEAVAGSEPAVRFALNGPIGEAQLELDTAPLAQFLTQRALEREQARVEHMQAVLLERQRLRREASYFRALEAQRQAAEAERVRLEAEAERQRQEEERRRAEEARLREEEARRQAEQPRQGAGELEDSPPLGAEPGPVIPQAPVQTPLPEAERDSPVERRPLPPPVQGNEPRSDMSPGDAAEEGLHPQPVLRADELTVEKLLELLEQ
jgi:uncharacterized protein involved in outer membrane biogenesis